MGVQVHTTDVDPRGRTADLPRVEGETLRWLSEALQLFLLRPQPHSLRVCPHFNVEAKAQR